jgi:hypothetical protein
VGHLIMVIGWWHWFEQGYPGVFETLKLIKWKNYSQPYSY